MNLKITVQQRAKYHFHSLDISEIGVWKIKRQKDP